MQGDDMTTTTTIPQYESVRDAYDAEFGHLEHADNFRVAQIGDTEAMHDYLKAMRRGCCGSKDIVVSIAITYNTGADTQKFYWEHLLGCNYGH
jgi:hypothetical protein